MILYGSLCNLMQMYGKYYARAQNHCMSLSLAVSRRTGERASKRVCVCVYVRARDIIFLLLFLQICLHYSCCMCCCCCWWLYFCKYMHFSHIISLFLWWICSTAVISTWIFLSFLLFIDFLTRFIYHNFYFVRFCFFRFVFIARHAGN